jgi:hypothetical protein
VTHHHEYGSNVVDQHHQAVSQTEDNVGFCNVFGYYVSFSEGPVRTLSDAFLGNTAQIQHAEMIMRECTYPYDFFVIEYDNGTHIVSRYYDTHGKPRFVVDRSRA